MRLSLVLVGSVLFATACSNFDDADVKKPATEDPYAERTKQTKSGDLNDEQQLKSGPLTNIACGFENACAPGTGCCVTANGPVCSNRCDTGKLFACLSNNDCGDGQACCIKGNTAVCASSCNDDIRVCNDGSQCGADETCSEERCNGVYSFAVCRKAGQESRQIDCGPSEELGLIMRNDPPPAPDPGPVP